MSAVPPAVASVLQAAEVDSLRELYPHRLVVQAIRDQLEAERNGGAQPADRVEAISRRLEEWVSPHLRRVINATGVVLHTNLGRSPLSERAVEAVVQIAGRYSNVELDLESGRRGDRQSLVTDVIRRLTGAESALVVNNNAAAILLALEALTRRREVIVSRGQQVEIGGSFRIPDVMRLSGSRMVEVGTTNRTRAEDYVAAITPRTGALLRVHTSNFRVVGFTEAVSLKEMADIARRHGILLIDDVGSGAMSPGVEPSVLESVELADVTTFSGDKLLGGPQAGLALGRSELISRMARSPLARAVRIDKLTLAALEATLLDHLLGVPTPAARMQALELEGLQERAQTLVAALLARGISSSVVPSSSVMGGGSQPGIEIPTVLVALPGRPGALATRLRRGRPAVMCRIQDAACCLDLRTVAPDEEAELVAAIVAASDPSRPNDPNRPGV